MKPDSSHGSEILTSEAIEILRRACKNSKTRSAVVRDPRAFLARHGIELADDVELRIYEQKGRSSGAEVAEPLLSKDLVKYAEARDVPPGLATWWQTTHQGCPFGTFPFTTKKKVTVCDKWVLRLEVGNGCKTWPARLMATGSTRTSTRFASFHTSRRSS